MKKIICATAFLALVGCNKTPQQTTDSALAENSVAESALKLFTDYKANAEQLIVLIDTDGTDADIEKYSAGLVSA